MEAWGVLCSSEALAAHESTYSSRRYDYGPVVPRVVGERSPGYWVRIRKGEQCPLSLPRASANIFQDVDIICCPAMTSPPFSITLEEMYGPSFLLDNPHWGRFTVPYGFSGSPSISVPCGKNSEGPPLAIQFGGRLFSEPLLCRIGHTFEQTTDLTAFRPNID